ncbi:hypothetical protein A6R68_07441 [Neotoma lepida]|uniref:Uncharacterized protein n=1 Tax=Neotoma lepida TaxID=56216 RepID=A0A1A6GE39_NEOLE|nr:hypothetical protein A6R68_07441 [Neotoma lepida]
MAGIPLGLGVATKSTQDYRQVVPMAIVVHLSLLVKMACSVE